MLLQIVLKSLCIRCMCYVNIKPWVLISVDFNLPPLFAVRLTPQTNSVFFRFYLLLFCFWLIICLLNKP